MTKKEHCSEQKDVNVDMDTVCDHESKRASMELKSLLSPEKALYLLYNLVDRNPNLWLDLHQLLQPAGTTDDELDGKRSQCDMHIIDKVLRNLRDLQLSQLAMDTLSVIISFLPLIDCLRFSETCHFFHELIPKYIDAISLEQLHSIQPSMYSLFFKCQRLRYLSIDATSKYDDHEHHEHALLFLFPFDRFRNLRELILINISFVNNSPNQFAFNGGMYSLCDLQLISCQAIECSVWLQLTSIQHSPNLTNLAIRNCSTYQSQSQPSSSSIQHVQHHHHHHDLLRHLVLSTQHTQIRNLTLTLFDADIVKLMRMNRCFIHNLHKLELGLIDKRVRTRRGRIHQRYQEQQEDHVDISAIFRQLFMSSSNTDIDNEHQFANLQILLIDFCPLPHARGYDDISPTDLHDFALHLPHTFPSLKLLGLYGSHSPLLFNDDHLYGFLRAKCLPQIIDLSIGFEDLSINYQRDHNATNLVQEILNTLT